MANNDSEKVYVVTHRHVTNYQDGGQTSNVDVLGVCRDLEEAKRIAWEMINESISEYESGDGFEITYRPSEDQINRGIEMLGQTVYMHIKAHHIGTTLIRMVHVFETKMT